MKLNLFSLSVSFVGFKVVLNACNKIIMSIEAYSPTRAERVNPEFIGIAKKHSSYKQKRRQL